jgi:uncharacterized membrane protein YccC
MGLHWTTGFRRRQRYWERRSVRNPTQQSSEHFGHTLLVFAIGVFVLGLLCAAAHLDRSAYRFGGVTLAIVLLVPRNAPAWQVAFHRFAEVSIGIAVALIFTLVWPEREAAPSENSSAHA